MSRRLRLLFRRRPNPIGLSLRGYRRATALSVERLEARRVMAAVELLLYTDTDQSGSFEAGVDEVAAGRFIFVDADANGAFEVGEAFAVTDDTGLAALTLPGGGLWPVQTFEGDAGLYATADSGSPDVPLELVVPSSGMAAAPAWSVDRLTFSMDEDGELPLGDEELRSRLLDPDEPAVELMILTGLQLGRFEAALDGSRKYVPNADANGRETLLVAARVGTLWSKAVPVEIDIAPIDDLPTQVELNFVASVPENLADALIATYEVDDVDGGELAIVFGVDDMFYALDGEIRLRAGLELNFESGDELPVSVGFSAGGEELLNRSEVLSISDQPDPIEGIVFQGLPRVEEFRPGYWFGPLQVVDEDRDEDYSWEVSDDRFMVSELNELQLKPGQYLMTRDGTSVPLVLTASGSKGGEPFQHELTIEVLQAPPVFQNRPVTLDVNDDGVVTPLDALAVINAINSGGARRLDGPPPQGEYNYIDVNGDWALTPLDVLIVINYLNSRPRGEASGPPPGYGGSSLDEQRLAGEGEPRHTTSPATQPAPTPLRSSSLASSTSLPADAVDFYWSADDTVDRLNRRR